MIVVKIGDGGGDDFEMMIRNDLLTCTEVGAGLCVGLVGSGYQWAQVGTSGRGARSK